MIIGNQDILLLLALIIMLFGRVALLETRDLISVIVPFLFLSLLLSIVLRSPFSRGALL